MSTARQPDYCSIVVDREHEERFAEQIAAHADKRYLTTAVERWRQEREYAYLMVLEDDSDRAAITFVVKKRFAETLVETFAELRGTTCLWVLFIGDENHTIFQQVLEADNETELGHSLN